MSFVTIPKKVNIRVIVNTDVQYIFIQQLKVLIRKNGYKRENETGNTTNQHQRHHQHEKLKQIVHTRQPDITVQKIKLRRTSKTTHLFALTMLD